MVNELSAATSSSLSLPLSLHFCHFHPLHFFSPRFSCRLTRCVSDTKKTRDSHKVPLGIEERGGEWEYFTVRRGDETRGEEKEEEKAQERTQSSERIDECAFHFASLSTFVDRLTNASKQKCLPGRRERQTHRRWTDVNRSSGRCVFFFFFFRWLFSLLFSFW